MDNKKRLIDADDLDLRWLAWLRHADGSAFSDYEQGYNDAVVSCIGQIESAPTIDAVEVVHGRWEEYQVPHIMCCSECDWATGVQDDFNYCPNCGAKMDAERKDND